jgi:ADP-ribose pyrophosphatase
MDAWEVLSRRLAYSAQPFFDVFVEDVRLPGGRVIDNYHQIDAGNIALIVGETDDGRILFLREYRHGSRRSGLTLPGGRIEAGEDSLTGARRELLEETGYRAREWRLLADCETSCSYGFNQNRYYLAQGLTWVQPPDGGDLEQAEPVLLARGEAVEALLSGEILSSVHAYPVALRLLYEAIGRPLPSLARD